MHLPSNKIATTTVYIRMPSRKMLKMTNFEFDNNTRVSKIMRRLSNRIPGLYSYKLYYQLEEVGASRGIVDILGVPDTTLLGSQYPYSHNLELTLVEFISVRTIVKVGNSLNPEFDNKSFMFIEARTTDKLELYTSKSSNSELNELISNIIKYCEFESVVVRTFGINIKYTTTLSTSIAILDVLDELKDEYGLLKQAVITIECNYKPNDAGA